MTTTTEPTHEQIALLAYEHWLSEGQPQGQALLDWEWALTTLTNQEVDNKPPNPWIKISQYILAAIIVAIFAAFFLPIIYSLFHPKPSPVPVSKASPTSTSTFAVAEKSLPISPITHVHGKSVISTEIDTIRPNCGIHGNTVDADPITVHELNKGKFIKTVKAYRLWCSDGIHLVSLTK